MKKKEWFSPEKLKGIPKNQLLIGGLAGVLLLVIALPTEQKKQQETELSQGKESGVEQPAANYSGYEKELERKLEEILTAMEGVGKVEVMITLQDNGEQVLEKDISRNSQEVTEEGEVKRNTYESQYQEETVFVKESGNEGQPFIAKESVPAVEGVLVVAEGGGNGKVAKNISDAVLALFPVEVHKIKVVKMN
ncbi:stage III sporulation protein AG [Eubacterium sp. 14-2]|uniref:stage III sporulation protein AG n=1 Tax=Eubacterium sp. 14-2 TaxID=1235790 RepID=UPI0003382553|nr:stage III sporulation protein AG [Eubacterium sp. 14-2]EOT21690.1 stage III sporulation protein AG [Eubacterium sp. 14-2]